MRPRSAPVICAPACLPAARALGLPAKPRRRPQAIGRPKATGRPPAVCRAGNFVYRRGRCSRRDCPVQGLSGTGATCQRREQTGGSSRLGPARVVGASRRASPPETRLAASQHAPSSTARPRPRPSSTTSPPRLEGGGGHLEQHVAYSRVALPRRVLERRAAPPVHRVHVGPLPPRPPCNKGGGCAEAPAPRLYSRGAGPAGRQRRGWR